MFMLLMVEVVDRGDGTFFVVVDKWYNVVYLVDVIVLMVVVVII